MGLLRELACLLVGTPLSSTDRGDYGGPLPPVNSREVLYFRPVQSASAAIAFFHKVNLYSHLPTQSPVVGIMVRRATTRKFGLTPKGRKEPFRYTQVVSLALAYGVHNQGYFHLIVASMALVMFGGM